jgi:hypothetical protein
MLSVIMLSIIILNVVASSKETFSLELSDDESDKKNAAVCPPFFHRNSFFKTFFRFSIFKKKKSFFNKFLSFNF